MLITSQIKAYKASSQCEYLWDKTGTRGEGRLGVQCLKSGSKIFVFRFFIDGKRQFLQLGSFPDLSLEKARALAQSYGQMLKGGLNPREELEKERLAKENEADRVRQEQEIANRQGSLGQLIDAYICRLKIDGKRSGERIRKAIKADVYSSIDPMTKARDVKPADVKLVLAKMIQRGASAQSNKVRAYLHAAFNFGLKHDNDPANMYSQTLFNIEHNPVSSVPKQTHADRVGERWLRWNEVYALLDDETQAYFSDEMYLLLKLCLHLGGQRPYEVISTRWEDIDWNAMTFEITSDISKNKRPNLIPMTQTTLFLLQELHKLTGDTPFLFPSQKRNGAMKTDAFGRAINKFCKKSGFERFVPRDLRRTVKTLMGELRISKVDRDHLQNHALNDVSTKHYDRYDYFTEKKSALEIWENKLNQTSSTLSQSNVVNLFG